MTKIKTPPSSLPTPSQSPSSPSLLPFLFPISSSTSPLNSSPSQSQSSPMQHHNNNSSSSSSPPNTIMSISPMGGGLARYGSAPGSFLSSLVVDPDSAPASEPNLLGRSRFFNPGDSPCLTSESTCKTAGNDPQDLNSGGAFGNKNKSLGLEMGLDRSYGFNEIQVGDLGMNSRSEAGGSSAPLFRHSSSPAGFLSHLMVDNGFHVSKGATGYSNPANDVSNMMPNRRLKSQLSFSSRQDSLSHISEISSDDAAGGNIGQTYMASNFPIGSWDDSNSIVFSAPPASKRGKDHNGDIMVALSNVDSHVYNLSRNSLDMASVENLFQIQQDSVPCKIRAKRGCATHPRSIAERERRTRISDKLRKLQELVPNMDKQTSTADMLDLAVQHIKGLQTQIQKLNQESADCTCSRKQDI